MIRTRKDAKLHTFHGTSGTEAYSSLNHGKFILFVNTSLCSTGNAAKVTLHWCAAQDGEAQGRAMESQRTTIDGRLPKYQVISHSHSISPYFDTNINILSSRSYTIALLDRNTV